MLAGKSDDQACEYQVAPPHPAATHMRGSSKGMSPTGVLHAVPQRAESALKQRLEAVAEDEQPPVSSSSSTAAMPAVLHEQCATGHAACSQELGAGSGAMTRQPGGQHPLLLHLPSSGSLITPSRLLKPAEPKLVGRWLIECSVCMWMHDSKRACISRPSLMLLSDCMQSRLSANPRAAADTLL